MNSSSVRESMAAGLALALLLAIATPGAADVVRTRYASGQGRDRAAKIVSVGALVFPSAVEGTAATPLEQVDEIVERMHEDLQEIGLGIGHMIQHTIYLKDGAAPPIEVLQRFHARATTLAPWLKEKASAGTIVRLPAFANPKTTVMVDVVAANPGAGRADTFARVPFTFGPKEIVETVAVGPLMFTAGNEAMDFEHRKLPAGIDEQVEAVVGKMQASLQKSGLSIGHMVAHNIYVTRGTDPLHVIQKFHDAARKRAPELAQRPSVGTLAIVDGMAAPGFLLEIDAVAAIRDKGTPDTLARVPFTEAPMDIAKSVAVGDLVFLAGMEGVDFSKQGAVSSDVVAQVEVAVKKIDDTLKQSGLSIGHMVKHKLYMKAGVDALKIRDAFHAAAVRLAPELAKAPSAETIVIVEGLATPAMAFEASVIAARTR